MSLDRQKILGIRVTTSKKEIILEEVKKWLSEKSGKPRIIVTPNPEQVMAAQSEKRFADILNLADVAIPDGTGVALALGIPRIAGIEFMEDLVKFAAKRGVTIGLIGGFRGLAVKALECLKAKYPGIRGWAWEPGELDLGDLCEKIRKTNTRFVFVGLGAPKQEYFIARLARESLKLKVQSPKVFMSVGGSFAMIAGLLKRAPVFIRSIGFEWAWRLFQEPWRFRRQLALLKFAVLVIAEKVRTA